MLTWFRRRAQRLAATVLVSLGAMGLSLLAPHPLDCHDAECGIGIVHDANAHQIGSEQSTQKGEPFHCLACHWARSFRPQIESRILPLLVRHATVRIVHELVIVVRAAPAAQPPLRSPPAVA